MRVLLWLLLCLTIPFQGVAVAHAIKTPCPMELMGQELMGQEQMAHELMASDSDSAGDCCNDPVTVAKTGQLCKAGQECPTGGLGILDYPAVAASTRIRALTISFPAPFNPRFNPSSVWRPPALI